MPLASYSGNTARTITSPVSEQPEQNPTTGPASVHTQPLTRPLAIAFAVDSGVIPSVASREIDNGFSRVRARTENRASMSPY